MSSNALKYAMWILLLIVAGSFYLAWSGREIPTFMMEIALTLAIAIAILVTHDIPSSSHED
jgi:hypothetical protein